MRDHWSPEFSNLSQLQTKFEQLAYAEVVLNETGVTSKTQPVLIANQMTHEREPLFISASAYLTIAGALGIALSYQWYVWFGREKTFLHIASVTLLTTYLWALFGLATWELLQRFPLRRKTIFRDLFAYTAAASLLLIAQQVRFFLFGGFGNPSRRLSYFHNLSFFLYREGIFYVLICVAIVVLLRGMYAQRRMQRLMIQAAKLEQQIAHMELESLRSRLHPHFFFNALNTISAFVHDAPLQADRTIELLSRLLRRNLEADREATNTLAEELTWANDYLEMQQIRFGDRLRYDVQCGRELADAEIPTLLLQPLVENCVVHGVESSEGDIEVRLRCAAEGNQLIITLENTYNDGMPRRGFGTGLNSVSRRLKLLYSEEGSLATEANGAFRVRIALPLRGKSGVREIAAGESE